MMVPMMVRMLRRALALAALALALPASAGDTDAEMYQAAKLHRAGDTGAAVAIWRAQAAAGNADAAYNLAVIHQHGDGVARDLGEAIKWYRLAAEQGDKIAQFQIGLMYQRGEGVPADPEEAHRWFTRHRAHHVHHQHDPQMEAWRRQAAALIAERDRRESLVTARRDAAQVLADLQRRAAMVAAAPAVAPLAAAPRPPSLH
jgi:hypothetical protein